ncbi:MAG: acetamidase/formamidase family protein, partial [Candidatus Lutacidiplasmatales archaeon]
MCPGGSESTLARADKRACESRVSSKAAGHSFDEPELRWRRVLASRWLDGNDPSLQQTNWSGDRPPIASVRSGDRIRVRLPDSSTGQLTKRSTRQDLGRLDLERVDAALGPIEVRGARAG